MKRIRIIMIAFLFGFLLFAGNASSFHGNFRLLQNRFIENSTIVYDLCKIDDNNDFNDFTFDPMDIRLEDDAYHKSRGLHFCEWWYFDATFDNSYSAQFSIRVFDILNRYVFLAGLNIYKDGNLIANSNKLYPRDQVFASTSEPLILLDGKEVMRGYIDENTGDWTYLINLEIDGLSVDLTYIGETKGWKGATPGVGWWGVILPRAKVTGNLSLNGIVLNVNGIGYHDHNWDVKVSATVNFGWYWGKIDSPEYTITWADVKMTRFSENPFMVINIKNGEYVNIPSSSIHIIPNNLKFSNRRFIPDSITLIVEHDDIQLNIDMEIIDTHHFRRFGFLNYWRFHLYCSGQLTINGQTEIIDEYNIAEFLRFR